MKNLIIEKIEELGENVSFVDLMALPGFAGDEHLGLPEFNFVYWMDVSCIFVQSMCDLVRDGVVVIDLTDPVTYMIDGILVDLPLVKDAIKYETSRWLPVVLNKGPNFYSNQEEKVA